MAERQSFSGSLQESGLIVMFALALGLVYNALSPRGISLIRETRPFNASNDSTRSSPSSSSARLTFINADEAVKIFQGGNGIFIDARHEDEFNEGHIKGALSLPLRTLETNPGLIQGLPKDTLIVTYCSGEECALSIDLGEKLVAMGFTNVKVFFSGWLEWQKRNLPVETGPKATS